MKRRVWIWCGALVILASLSALYLSTCGRYFLPLPSPASYAHAPVETRTYLPIPSYAAGRSRAFNYEGLVYRFARPGEFSYMNEQETICVAPFETFLEAHYPFVAGTSAQQTDEFPDRWQITHHGPMLDRIERDLGLVRAAPTTLVPVR